jgi:hypothetical protein
VVDERGLDNRGKMGDKAAAEVRRQKIRNLEYSLFGGNDNNNVSIGAILA